MMTLPYRLLFSLILLFLMLFGTETVFAKTITDTVNTSAPQNTDTAQAFDYILANKILNQLKSNTPPGNITVKELQTTISALTKLQVQAKKCITIKTTQLDQLNQRINEISLIKAEAAQQQQNLSFLDEQKYLANKKNEVDQQLSECRLFLLRADDAKETLGNKLRKLVTTRLLYPHSNTLENIQDLPEKINASWQSFDMTTFANKSGITFILNENPVLLLLSLLVLAAIFYISQSLRKKLPPLIGSKTQTRFSLQIQQALLAVLNHYLPLFSIAISLAIFFSIFTHSLLTPSYLAWASYAFLQYLLFLSLVRFFFCPPPPAQGLTRLPEPIAKTLTKRLNKFALLWLVIYVIYIFLSHQNIEPSLIDLFRTVVITLLSINLISIIWIIKNFPKIERKHPIFRFFISLFLTCLLLFILMAEYLGYHLLALYLLYGIIMTILLTFTAKFLNQIISAALDALKGTNLPWQKKLRANFGLKRNETFVEILWLRAICYFAVWLVFLVLMLKIWGLSQENFQGLMGHLLYGFDIGKLHLIPSRILIAALLFIFLTLTTRWLRASIVKNSAWHLEHSSKQSLASIVGYIGFAFAFLFAALIAGVNFSGLALIAGALSVGIGFGLQNIVNNFVSGIILLIERPIKLGDRIIVGQTEGYVKQISIRSTHIITTQYSDVIVPNSELISQQVTNYMLYDMNYKIFTAVGIAYGSDTLLAKELLLEIANAHPQVITDNENLKPAVYFRTFGESSLNFELYCVIKDVNMKFDVVSDLNFAIEKTFKDKGIEIAFPQRDLRIVKWPESS